MTELCLRIYRYFRSHRASCWLSLAGLFLFCGYFAAQIHLEEDLNKLMPSSRNEDGTTKLASLQRIGLVKSYTHPAIRSVGFSTLVGLVSAVVLSYVVQPAVYGWINRKGGEA